MVGNEDRVVVEGLQQEMSNQIISLKSVMGSMAELIESWVLSLEKEHERHERISLISLVLEKPDCGMNPEDLKVCREHLECLLGTETNQELFSSSYRKKLQWLFQEQLEKLNKDLDALFKQVGKVWEIAKGEPEPAGGLIMAQEDERKRISREIHDGPAQSLANLTMRVDFCLEQLEKPEILRRELADLKNSITRSLKDIRRFIFDLRPMALDDLGLIPTIEQFLAGFKVRTGLNVHLNVDGERSPLSAEKELAVFRVIQEAVNNSNRHAKSKGVWVFLSFEKEKSILDCVIKDDGSGFDVAQIRKNYLHLRKLGLLSMEERVKLAGGKLNIVSGAGEGTVVSFSIPI